MSDIKNEYGILLNFCFCYIVVIENGFVFEGYVFFKFIKWFLLEEYLKVIGLFVLVMLVGLSGMEVVE